MSNSETRCSSTNLTDSIRKILPWTLPILVLLVAVVMRSISYLHDDVSWLITMAEQFYQGKRAYVDIIDVNPPAAFLIYTPQVAFASVFGITSELAVTLSVFGSALVSTVIAGSILLDAGVIRKNLFPYLSALSFAILLVLCGDVFAQREHFALIGLLPLLSSYVARAIGHTPNRGVLLLAGLGGCIALAIKPYFIFAVGLPLFYVAWQHRKTFSSVLKILFGFENLTMILGELIYLGTIYALFPIYFRSIVPMAIDIYLPIRLSAGALLLHASTWAICCSGALALAIGYCRTVTSVFTICVLAALGFAVAYLVQAKGWPYHAYPSVALFQFAIGIEIIAYASSGLLQYPIRPSVTIMALTGALVSLFVAADLRWAKLPLSYPPIYPALKAIAPPRATVVGISQDMGSAQVTRLVGATWVGRVPYQFMWRYATQVQHANARLTAETAKRLSGYIDLDQAMLVDEIRNRKPDVVLISDPNMRRWALSRPTIAAALLDYREASVVEGVGIWTRRRGP